jgi:hypothetical protein
MFPFSELNFLLRVSSPNPNPSPRLKRRRRRIKLKGENANQTVLKNSKIGILVLWKNQNTTSVIKIKRNQGKSCF